MAFLKGFWTKKTLIVLALGQFVSLLITSTGFSSSELSRKGATSTFSPWYINSVHGLFFFLVSWCEFWCVSVMLCWLLMRKSQVGGFACLVLCNEIFFLILYLLCFVLVGRWLSWLVEEWNWCSNWYVTGCFWMNGFFVWSLGPGINAPTSQSFANYVLLAIVYGTFLIYRREALQVCFCSGFLYFNYLPISKTIRLSSKTIFFICGRKFASTICNFWSIFW